MKEKTINVRSLVEKYQANCARIKEIADLCDKEQRSRTEAETKEYEALARDNEMLRMRMLAYQGQAASAAASLGTQIREAMQQGGRQNVSVGRELTLRRDKTMVSDVAAGGLVPDLVQTPVLPLMEQTIYDLVGIPMQQGLAGNFVWPVVEFGAATINGEGESLETQKLKFSKLTASPERIGYAYEATRESIEQSNGVVENLINTTIPMGVNDLINRIVMSPTKQTGAQLMQGPFVDLVADAATIAATADAIAWSDLNKLKAEILKTGIRGEKLAWVMSKATAAVLEGTPVNAKGIFRPMLENGTLCGIPVFTTEAITNKYIGLGDWSYQPAGFFGQPTLIVDPYTTALDNSVRFVYNTHFATKTIRKEAFKLVKIGE